MVVEVEAPSGFIVAMIMRFEACLQHFLFGRIEIRERLSKLPAQLTPTQQDWTAISVADACLCKNALCTTLMTVLTAMDPSHVTYCRNNLHQ